MCKWRRSQQRGRLKAAESRRPVDVDPGHRWREAAVFTEMARGRLEERRGPQELLGRGRRRPAPMRTPETMTGADEREGRGGGN